MNRHSATHEDQEQHDLPRTNPYARGERDVFGELVFGDDDARFQPGKCTSIPVTPELQARDAAERAGREQQLTSAWALKAQLSASNLPGGGSQKAIAAQARRVMRPCKYCGQSFSTAELQRHMPRCLHKPAKPVSKQPVNPKPQPAPKETAPMPTGKTSPFTIGTPLAASSVPSHSAMGRTSPYLPIYTELVGLRSGMFLPITVGGMDIAKPILISLAKMAKNDGRKLDSRRDAEGKTIFLALTPREGEAA